VSNRSLPPAFRIGAREIGAGAPSYIVAEAGTNHNGSLDTARELIRTFAAAGADAVKFQSIQVDKIFHPDDLHAEARAFWHDLELPPRWLPKLAAEADAHGVHLLSTPCYPEAIPGLVKVGVPAIKIASRQAARHHELVAAAARTGLPLIASLGLCDLGATHRLLKVIREAGGTAVALLRCTPRYPADAKDANLAGMATLRGAFGVPVGYSDHTLGPAVPVGAAALGAAVLEKHVTLDRSHPGPDHHFAMEPDDFAALVAAVRAVEAARGDGALDALPEADRALFDDSASYLVAAKKLARGDRLTRARLRFLRTGRGIPLEDIPRALGRKLRRGVPAGRILTWADLAPPEGEA
jgi:sialic acid synthase SpsE